MESCMIHVAFVLQLLSDFLAYTSEATRLAAALVRQCGNPTVSEETLLVSIFLNLGWRRSAGVLIALFWGSGVLRGALAVAFL